MLKRLVTYLFLVFFFAGLLAGVAGLTMTLLFGLRGVVFIGLGATMGALIGILLASWVWRAEQEELSARIVADES